MLATSLLNGCALVIDDEINDNKSSISKMISTLESEGTLFVKSKNLLANNARDNLSGVTFIILDWDIRSEAQLALPSDIQLGSALTNSKANEIITFIKEVLARYFVPIFIFSQQDKATIHTTLEGDPDIYPMINRRVFVENKSKLSGEKVKKYLKNWIESNNTVLALKMFEEQLNLSKNAFLVELGELTTDWVMVVYKTLCDDHEEHPESSRRDFVNADFNEFLLHSLLSRLEYADYTKMDFTKPKKYAIDKADINKIYESIKFYSYKTPVNPRQAYEGDLYRKKCSTSDSEFADEFFVNLNAPCDLRSDKMLLIKGSLIDESVKSSEPKIGESKSAYDLRIFMGKDAIRFKFRNIRYIKKPSNNNLEELTIVNDTYKRIGRITHPYITAIRSEYAHFISRQGIPRHPEELFQKKKTKKKCNDFIS